MQKLEQEKIKLLQEELKITAKLKYESRVHGANLEEMENMVEAGTRDRELTLTKLYARLNNHIRK